MTLIVDVNRVRRPAHHVPSSNHPRPYVPGPEPCLCHSVTLAQHYLIELSAVLKMFCTYTVQYHSTSPMWLRSS